MATEPDQEDKIEIVDGMLTERGTARIYARAQIERLDPDAHPPLSVGLGTYVITFGWGPGDLPQGTGDHAA